MKENIGSFKNTVTIINIKDYKQGFVYQYDYIFFYKIKNGIDNKLLKVDLDKSNKEIYWIKDSSQLDLNNGIQDSFKQDSKYQKIYLKIDNVNSTWKL
ncbi:hypothetical protein [Clostridium sp.]|jgi:uncharacterized protein YdaL|uniref:hypothetical protein n=1 Tax=Clostridium sp. TaxID=1506 RepID=UPI00258F3BD3|nr:hypothetical protein [Clostridium sp.]MDF2505196.1 hypothetical protein [Clostridium sp.]